MKEPLGALLCLVLVPIVLVDAKPSVAPPPPIRTYQTVPPPPSPPPGLLASFIAKSEFSLAQLGSWKEGQTINPRVGILFAQAVDSRVVIYGMLSGQTPGTSLTSVLSEVTCAALAPSAGAVINVVEPDGTMTLETTQMMDISGSALTTAAAQSLARSGFAAIYTSAGELLMCAQLQVAPHTQVVLIGRMPQQYNQRTARGLIVLQRTAVLDASEMRMHGIIHGLEAEFHGMWHFHRGFNCLAATEDIDFYEGIFAGYRTARSAVRGGDLWTYGNYRSDPRGVALISKTFKLDSPDLMNTMSREMAEFQTECGGAMPPTFIGRQMIVHGRDGSYIGCGGISEYLPGVTDAIAVLTKYHYYRGTLKPKALIHVNEDSSHVVSVTAVLSGLAVSGEVEIRIHAGFECPGPDEVLSMLYPPVAQPNPSTIQTGDPLVAMSANADQFGNIFYQSIINGTALRSLAGRVIIVVDKASSDTELACGVIEPTSLLVAPVVPSSAAPLIKGGLVIAAQASSGVALRGTLLTTTASTEAKISFKSSCDSTIDLIREITLAESNGAFELKRHISGISIDPLNEGPSLRDTIVKVLISGDSICGTLIGPLSEIPTPRNDICSTTQKLRGSSIGFACLGSIMFGLIVAIAVLLRNDLLESVARKAVYAKKIAVRSTDTLSRLAHKDAHSLDPVGVHLSLKTRGGMPQVGALETDTTPDTVVEPKAANRFRRESVAIRVRQSILNLSAHSQSRKPRLLALHGAGSNKEICTRQLRNLGIDEHLFTIHYLEGPLPVEVAGVGLEGYFNGPFYSWFNGQNLHGMNMTTLGRQKSSTLKLRRTSMIKDLDAAKDKEAMLSMLGNVVMFIKEQDIDGVFGFSQGAAVASAIMQPEVRELLSVHLGKKMKSRRRRRSSITSAFVNRVDVRQARRRSSITSAFKEFSMVLGKNSGGQERYNANFNLKFTLCAHSSTTDVIRKALGLQPLALPNTIKGCSIHLIGLSDPMKPKSEAEALAFEGGVKRLVLYHAGAHELPRELESNELLYRRMMTLVAESLKPQSDDGMLIFKCVQKFKKLSKTLQARLALEKAQQVAISVVVRKEKQISFPTEFRQTAGALYSIQQAEAEKVFFADHLIAPTPAKRQLYRPISNLSSVWVSPLQQLVRVKISREADEKPLTLRGLLKAQSYDAPCLRAAAEPGKATTYGQLHDFIAPGGKGDLSALGININDSVIYVAPGGAAAAVAFITIASQCIAAPLDLTVMQADAADAIDQFEAKHIILFEGVPADGVRAAAMAVRAAGKTIFIHTGNVGGEDMPGLFELTPDPTLQKPERVALETGADDTVLLLRTSGTTARPKGVPLQQGSIVRNGLILSSTIEISEKDVCLNAMPLFHIGGLSASILATLATGGSVTCLDAFSPEKFTAALAAEPQPTWYSAVPTIHMAVVNHLKDEGIAPKHSLRFIRSGAAALNPTDGKELSACYGNIPIHGTYSMSEQMPISQPNVGLDQLHEKSGSVGIACAASMAIVNPVTLAPQPPGMRGVIAISGPTVMRSYLANPKANADNYFLLSCADGTSPQQDDQFFLTGDVGVLDSDGHLTIKGRSKELIKRGGEQVSPYEVEDALKVHEWVRMPVVFAVPSDTWGEEVGAAIILEPTAPEEANTPKALLKEMRGSCRTQGLAPNKWPSVVVVVSWETLPKTKTNKPIRSGLAVTLGVEPPKLDETTNKKGPPKISRALEGVRFFLACQVVFNHVGLQSPGPGTRMPHDDESWGAFGQARFMCIHVPTFFALAGFGMSINMGPSPKSKVGFIMARLSPMYPMYLLSITLYMINTIAMCTPSVFDSTFHYLGQWNDKSRGDFCESAPLIDGYWGSLFSTMFVYLLGLQSWPVYLFSWFLSYYTWFSSVYYAMLFAHPFFYSHMTAIRGQVKLIWGVTACIVALNYCVVAGWFIGWVDDSNMGNLGTRDLEAEWTAQFSLMYYLFPPFWFPTYALGICAAFLYDYYRPYEKHSKWKWGVLTDCISFCLVFCGYIYYPMAATCKQKEGLMCPSVEPDGGRLAVDDMGLDQAFGVIESDSIGTRTIAGMWSRFLLPVMVLWLYGLATGEGYTVKLFSMSLFTDILAPISYNLYLFHQWVGQIYYLVTRMEWWSYWRYRKSFFWFSPAPVPVAWWEYFFVVILTTFLSFGLAKIDPWMISKWEAGRRKVRNLLFPGSSNTEDLTTLQLILQEVENLTGSEVEPDWTLAECGLSSVAGPVIINMLTRAVPGITISLADLMEVDTITGLADLLETRKKNMNATGIGTTTTQS